MEQLLYAFGIDVKLIIIQLLNFGILAVALTYFLYTPILNTLKKREEKIEQGILDAENAANAKAFAEEEKKKILSAAHVDAQEVAENAKKYADEKSIEIIESAQTKAESIITDAHGKGEEIKVQARKESADELAKVAVLAAEKVLQSN